MNKPLFINNIEKIFRKKRFLIFLDLISVVPRPIHILDLGGTLSFWQSNDYNYIGEFNITMLNIFQQYNLPSGFTSIVGDARSLINYKDKEFDLVFSNSTLNFVGSYEDQLKMASEIRRVGKGYFIQIPNRHFPLDWRTLVPFFHFMPSKFQAFCFQHFKVGTYPQVKDSSKAIELATRVRDVTRREMVFLFPEARIIQERVLGFSKSFMAYYV